MPKNGLADARPKPSSLPWKSASVSGTQATVTTTAAAAEEVVKPPVDSRAPGREPLFPGWSLPRLCHHQSGRQQNTRPPIVHRRVPCRDEHAGKRASSGTAR